MLADEERGHHCRAGVRALCKPESGPGAPADVMSSATTGPAGGSRRYCSYLSESRNACANAASCSVSRVEHRARRVERHPPHRGPVLVVVVDEERPPGCARTLARRRSARVDFGLPSTARVHGVAVEHEAARARGAVRPSGSIVASRPTRASATPLAHRRLVHGRDARPRCAIRSAWTRARGAGAVRSVAATRRARRTPRRGSAAGCRRSGGSAGSGSGRASSTASAMLKPEIQRSWKRERTSTAVSSVEREAVGDDRDVVVGRAPFGLDDAAEARRSGVAVGGTVPITISRSRNSIASRCSARSRWYESSCAPIASIESAMRSSDFGQLEIAVRGAASRTVPSSAAMSSGAIVVVERRSSSRLPPRRPAARAARSAAPAHAVERLAEREHSLEAGPVGEAAHPHAVHRRRP